MISGKEILFGKIALREGMISTLQLNDALALQEFSGSRLPLGEILRDQGVLDDEAVEQILSIQRGYAAVTDPRTRLDDCRGLLFGTIAVVHKFCTEDHLHDALRVQAIIERHIPISLGEIMVKRGYLTADQVRQVLKLQNRAIFLCPACDIVFNYPCQDLEDGQTPACLECGGALEQGEATISRRYFVVRRSGSSSRDPAASSDERQASSSSSDSRNVPMPPMPAIGQGDTSRRARPVFALGANDLADAVRAAGQASGRQTATRPPADRWPAMSDGDDAGHDPLDPDQPPAPRDASESGLNGANGEDNGNGNGHSSSSGLIGGPRSASSKWRRQPAALANVRVVENIKPTPFHFPGDEGRVRHGRRLGNYIVLREVGRGGMGVVYEATHAEQPGSRYAVKFIRQDLSNNDVYLRRFQREIALVLSLNHPNIVETYETGVKDGFHYLVMEYVDGENLGDVLEREGKLPVRRAVEITRQTALALSFAHRQGIIHRDMKPDNVILTRGGPEAGSLLAESVKITDFGLAKDLAGLDDALTLTGQLIGTPHYMSPEQCRGEYSDQRSDIYSLGCTLFHLLTGRPPFIGDNYLSVMEQQKSEPITPPHQINPAVPLSISFIVGKMLEKNADNRYPTLEVVLSHLEIWDSEKLADEIAKYAPAFSRVRAFTRGQQHEFGAVGQQQRKHLERLETEVKSARAEKDRLRKRVDSLEKQLLDQRDVRVLLAVISALVLALGVVIGILFARGG